MASGSVRVGRNRTTVRMPFGYQHTHGWGSMVVLCNALAWHGDAPVAKSVAAADLKSASARITSSSLVWGTSAFRCCKESECLHAP